jgi:hypothetical protein
MQMIATGKVTYWSWACSLATIIGERVSKQAIFERMTPAWVATIKALVKEVIKEQAASQPKKKLFDRFGQIWLQDSTCVQLPSILFNKYRGNTSGGKKNAVAKLNIIVNVVTGFCPVMSWSGFTVTEQRLSPDIMSIAQPKDLVIRDLGYFVLSVLNKMNESCIYFLSRWRNGVIVYEKASGKEINLKRLLKGKTYVDIEVLCGKDEKVKARLVAVKLPAEQANERRRKAKNDRHRNANHNKTYYYLLGYSIFITNVKEDIWSYKEVAEAYRVRWQVEILFKSWKSGFCMERLIPDAVSNTERVESILYLLLLYMVWCQELVYDKVRKYASEKEKMMLSMIRVAQWAITNTLKWLNGKLTVPLKREVLYYCCYDTRCRSNTVKRLEQFFASLA